MEEVEKFSAKKLLTSPLNPMYWVKSGSIGMGILVFVLVGYTVYRAYIKKPADTNKVIAKEGSTVNIISQAKRRFIPFVEAYINQPSNDDWNTGVRAGLRFEF